MQGTTSELIGTGCLNVSREETSEVVSQVLNAAILEKPAVVFYTISTVLAEVCEWGVRPVR